MNIPQAWLDARDDLVGTAKSDAEYEDLFNDLAFCSWLDQEIFMCSACGWWCEISEEASEDSDFDDLTCADCVSIG